MTAILIAWNNIKDVIVATSGWPRDGLHIAFGLVVFLTLAARSPHHTASVAAWLVLLGIEATNEVFDQVQAIRLTGATDLAASWHDLVFTMILPGSILLWAVTLRAWFPHYRRLRPSRR